MGINQDKCVEFEKDRLSFLCEEIGVEPAVLVQMVDKKSLSEERLLEIFSSGQATERELKWIAKALKVDAYDLFIPVDESDKLASKIEFRVPIGIGSLNMGTEAYFAIRKMKQFRQRVLDLKPDIRPV
jgi:hypothetical protein